MNKKKTASLMLKITGKLIAGEAISTEELIEALERKNVDTMLIDYIADLHLHKVEGETSTLTTSAKRFKQTLDASVAVNKVRDRAKRNDKTISKSDAINDAIVYEDTTKEEAKRVSPSTIRRRLKPYIRKR